MSQRNADPIAQAQLAEANENLNQRLREENAVKWRRVWDASGIKFASESMNSWIGTVRDPSGRNDAMNVGDVDLAPGDIVALRDEDTPSETNQHLHRVLGMEKTGGKNLITSFGPALPRSEWPEAMRQATAPTTIYVESTIGLKHCFVSVMTGDGNAICRVDSDPSATGIREGYLASAVAQSAKLGYADGIEGRQRSFEIIKGNGAQGGRYWQVSDDHGKVVDIERRNMLQRHPSQFVEAVLAATRAAYVEGMTEALDVKATRDMDVAAESPSMGM